MTSLSVTESTFQNPPYRIALQGSDEYSELSELIQRIFQKNYHAQVKVAYSQLLGVFDGSGAPRAALGMRSAANEKLFLERYLSQAAEKAVQDHTGLAICRAHIAEAGNLASSSMIHLRNLMLALSVALKQDGFKYILFTGTEGLKRYLELLGMKPVVYVDATPDKLGADAGRWGSYYDTHPKVMGGTTDDFYHGLITAYHKRMRP